MYYFLFIIPWFNINVVLISDHHARLSTVETRLTATDNKVEELWSKSLKNVLQNDASVKHYIPMMYV